MFERVPQPENRKSKKELRSLGIKFISPVTEADGRVLYKMSLPNAFRVVHNREAHESFVVNEERIAIVKLSLGPDGRPVTTVLKKPPAGIEVRREPVKKSDNPPMRPEMGLFFETFSCIIRGFIRQARPLERERFETLNALYPLVREWAGEFDADHPARVEQRGSMLEDVEAHMRCARDIIDVEHGDEKGAAVFDEPAVRSWILSNASAEKGELARSVYRRYTEALGEFDPKLSAEMREAHEEESRE